MVWFTGDHPCEKAGADITGIKHSSETIQLGTDIVVRHRFSNKPPGGSYSNYYDKITRYIAIISAPAQSVDPGVTARTYKPVAASAEESVFHYLDTASSRAGISAVTAKLAVAQRIAILGLGGTGGYVLDLTAKTPVPEIHLFDGDTLLSHNAFRAPAAASLEELRQRPTKVAYFHALYSKMRRGIVPHATHITEANVAELLTFGFVFLCMDSGPTKRLIIDTLVAGAIPFIDVGMGVELLQEELQLWGTCRVTAFADGKHEHLARRISYSANDEEDEYESNIQIADLNALNAALAVIKWKKHCGFYQDLEQELNTTYTTSSNLLTSDETP
jgi:uncharacterized protein DUF6791/ThiF family protein